MPSVAAANLQMIFIHTQCSQSCTSNVNVTVIGKVTLKNNQSLQHQRLLTEAVALS